MEPGHTRTRADNGTGTPLHLPRQYTEMEQHITRHHATHKKAATRAAFGIYYCKPGVTAFP